MSQIPVNILDAIDPRAAQVATEGAIAGADRAAKQQQFDQELKQRSFEKIQDATMALVQMKHEKEVEAAKLAAQERIAEKEASTQLSVEGTRQAGDTERQRQSLIAQKEADQRQQQLTWMMNNQSVRRSNILLNLLQGDVKQDGGVIAPEPGSGVRMDSGGGSGSFAAPETPSVGSGVLLPQAKNSSPLRTSDFAEDFLKADNAVKAAEAKLPAIMTAATLATESKGQFTAAMQTRLNDLAAQAAAYETRGAALAEKSKQAMEDVNRAWTSMDERFEVGKSAKAAYIPLSRDLIAFNPTDPTAFGRSNIGQKISKGIAEVFQGPASRTPEQDVQVANQYTVPYLMDLSKRIVPQDGAEPNVDTVKSQDKFRDLFLSLHTIQQGHTVGEKAGDVAKAKADAKRVVDDLVASGAVTKGELDQLLQGVSQNARATGLATAAGNSGGTKPTEYVNDDLAGLWPAFREVIGGAPSEGKYKPFGGQLAVALAAMTGKAKTHEEVKAFVGSMGLHPRSEKVMTDFLDQHFGAAPVQDYEKAMAARTTAEAEVQKAKASRGEADVRTLGGEQRRRESLHDRAVKELNRLDTADAEEMRKFFGGQK